MKNIGVLFLLAYHSTFLQGVYLLSEYSKEKVNNYELDVIENTDEGQHEIEIDYRLAELRSKSKDIGKDNSKYIKIYFSYYKFLSPQLENILEYYFRRL